MYTKGTLLPAYLSRPLLLRGRSAIQNYAQTKQKNKTRSYAISSFSDSVYFLTLGSSLFLFLSSSSSSRVFFSSSSSRLWCLLFPPVFLWSLFRAAGLSLVPFSCAVLCYFFLPAQRTSASALRHLLLGVVTKMCEGGGVTNMCEGAWAVCYLQHHCFRRLVTDVYRHIHQPFSLTYCLQAAITCA